jgi:RES domain-containing protein
MIGMTDDEALEVRQLFDEIAGCLPRSISFDGVVIRSEHYLRANQRDFLSGLGAATHGGRWNRPGIKTVYASMSVITAVRESYQNYLEFGFSEASIPPRVFCGARVRLQALFDLSDRTRRRRIGFSLNELLDEDWRSIQHDGEESWTQAIGRGARAAGFEGLIIPSARDRPRGKNLVVFPDRLHGGSKIEILGKDALPRHPARKA